MPEEKYEAINMLMTCLAEKKNAKILFIVTFSMEDIILKFL